MAISEHKTNFGDWLIVDWTPGTPLPDAEDLLARITLDYDDKATWSDRLAQFLETPEAAQVSGIVAGAWGEAMWDGGESPVVEPLVAAREQLANLKAIFIGDITSEECEISWIIQNDVSPLFGAFPNLEWLGVRGGTDLLLGVPRHEKLKGLVVETGGLSGEVVRALHGAQLPAL